MMSEKQMAFINKLLEEKAVSIEALAAKYHYTTGGRSHLPEFNELNSRQASWIIEQLIAAPCKPTAAQVAHFQSACYKYEQLIVWAKGQGLKVRSKMKKASIMKAIAEAGLQTPVELI